MKHCPHEYLPRRITAPALAFVAAIVVACPSVGRADEYDLFTSAKNAFDAGEYEEAVSRFNEILNAGLKNPALVLESLKLIAVSYLFVEDREMAEKRFTELLTIAPEYSLDPLIYPIEVVDFFMGIKQKNKARLSEMARARAREKARRKAEEAARQKAEMERLTRNVYLERSEQKNSLLVAMMPLGVGQFQNGHVVKGALFLGGELLLAAAATTTYFLHEGLRQRAAKPFSDPEEREDYENLEAGYRIANQASLVALSALALTGIADSLYNYQRVTVTWKKIEERDVPTKLRPGSQKRSTSIIPEIGDGSVGLVVSGSF